jgi:DNA-binding GntR family transcriptional regulator
VIFDLHNEDLKSVEPRFISPVDAPTRQEIVYQRLRDAIAAGELQQRDRIGLRELAQTLGVSTTPVREALRRLEAEGLVAVERGSGIRIQHLTPDAVREIVEMRARLETMVMEEAMTHLTDGDLERAGEILDRADNAADPDEWSALNIEFHGVLYDRTEFRRALSLVKTLWVAPEPYLRLYVQDPLNLRTSQQEHRDLLTALRAHDVAAALAEVEKHIRRTESAVLAAVAGYREAEVAMMVRGQGLPASAWNGLEKKP